MVILSKKQKSVTNVHLSVKVINKGPSEHFVFLFVCFWSEDFLICTCPFSLCRRSKSKLSCVCVSDSRSPPPPFPGSFLEPPCRVRPGRALKWR